MRFKMICFVAILAVGFCGCASMDEGTKKGAVIGGLIGATAGGIIGHQGGHGLEGALIGGAAGVLTGGWVGHKMDQKQIENNPEHVTVLKVVEMTADGVPDDVIISEIDQTDSTYEMTSEIVDYLRENNVSVEVIDHMLSTAE